MQQKLTPSIINVPLFGGMDSSIDTKLLEPGNNRVVENARLDTRGRANKRFGYTSTSTQRSDGSILNPGVQVFSAGNALLQHDGLALSAYSPGSNAWLPLGDACSAPVNALGVVQSQNTVTEISSAASSAYFVTAWAEAGNVYCSVTELATKTALVSRQLLAPGARSPNVLQLNGNFYIFSAVSVPADHFAAWTINASNPFTVVGGPVVPTAPGSLMVYDVCVDATNNQLLGVFDDSLGPTSNPAAWNWQVFSITPGLVFTPLSSNGTLKNTTGFYLSIFATPGVGGGSLVFSNFQAANSYFLRATGTALGAFVEVPSQWNTPGSTGGPVGIWATTATALNGVTAAPTAANTVFATNGDMRLASRAFNYNGNTYAWAVASDNLTTTQTATVTGGSNLITGLTTYSGIYVGSSVSGTNIPGGSVVTAITGVAGYGASYVLTLATQQAWTPVTAYVNNPLTLLAVPFQVPVFGGGSTAAVVLTVSATDYARVGINDKISYYNATTQTTYTATVVSLNSSGGNFITVAPSPSSTVSGWLTAGIGTVTAAARAVNILSTPGNTVVVSSNTVVNPGVSILTQGTLSSLITAQVASGVTISTTPTLGGSAALTFSLAGFQSQLFLIDQNAQIVGNLLSNGNSPGYDGRGISLPEVDTDGAGNFYFAQLYAQQLSFTQFGVAYTTNGAKVFSLGFKAGLFTAATLDGATYTSGLAPMFYDGTALTEQGFYNYPDLTTSVGSGNLFGGTYVVAALYGWYDATGKLWRSAPGPTLNTVGNVNVLPNGSISLSIPYLQTTRKQNAFIEIYCTANIGGQTGSTLYKVATVPNVSQPFSGAITGTAPPSLSVNYTISLADNLIQAGEPLYTTGGFPDFITTPASNYLAASGTRIYSLSGELNQVFASTIANPGSPLQFQAEQAVTIPSKTSAPQICSVMNSQLWVATKEKWLVTNADVSDTSQAIITFAPMRELPFTSGVASPASVIQTSDGIYHQNSNTLALLQRNESIITVGEQIKNIIQATPILSVYQVTSQQQIRFLCSGVILNYDTVNQAWSQSAFAGKPTLTSGCVWQGLGVLLGPSGPPALETAGVYFDDTYPVTVRIETPWIKPSNTASYTPTGVLMGSIAGWGRVWRYMILGERESAHTLQIRIAYQYSETQPGQPDWLITQSISSSAANAGIAAFGQGVGSFGTLGGALFGPNTSGTAYQFVGVNPIQKVGAIKFEITDQGSTGQDFALSSLALLVGVKHGLSVVPVAKEFG